MPKYKRRYRRRRGTKLAKTVYKNKKFIKMLKKGIEYKHLDTYPAIADVATPALAAIKDCLNLVDQGDNSDERDGKKIQGRSLLIRGVFKNNQNTPTDCTVRFMIVRWKSTQGETFSINDLLGSDTQDATTISPRATDTDGADPSNFKVYYDTLFSMDTSQHTFIPFKLRFRMTAVTEFIHASGVATEADLQKNGIYIVAFSDVASVDNCPQLLYQARYAYTDY